MKYQVIVIGCA